uniref:adhesion G-protein coupled receptor F3-like n=1 Tax=Myxine glutinosa TaxID=7769 RepID=UPI00358E1518
MVKTMMHKGCLVPLYGLVFLASGFNWTHAQTTSQNTENLSSEKVPQTDVNSSSFLTLQMDITFNNTITFHMIESALQSRFPLTTENNTLTFLSAELITECTIYPQELNCSCGSMYRFPPNVCSLYGCGSPLNSPCTCASASNTNITMLDCEPMVPTTMAPTLTTHFSTSTMAPTLTTYLSTMTATQTSSTTMTTPKASTIPTTTSTATTTQSTDTQSSSATTTTPATPKTSTIPTTTSTATTTQSTVAAQIHLNLNMIFIPQYENHSSSQYKELSTRLEKHISKTYERIKGFQRIKITRFSKGSVVTSYDVIGTTEMSIEEITRSTSGVETNLAKANISVNNVRMKKKGIVKSPSSEVVYEVGTKLTFSCFDQPGVNENVSWFKENTSVSTKGNWTIQIASFTDSGPYRCEINSGFMTLFESVKIVILERRIIMKQLPESLTYLSSGNISCCLSGEHDPTLTFRVTWHSSADTIIKQGIVSNCTSLLVNNAGSIPKSNPENYTCTFSYRDFTVSGTVKVGFYIKGNMSITPKGAIKESDIVSLTCPLPIANPTMKWTKDDEIITNGLVFILLDDEVPPRLQIEKIKSTHEGNYSCIAKQDGMTYQAKRTLSGIITKPRITKSTSSFTIRCEKPLPDLQCCVERSSQTTRVTWTQGKVTTTGEIQNNCSSYKPSVITRPCPQEETIRCLFSNNAGNDQEDIKIYFLNPEDSSCTNTSMGGYEWPKSKANTTVYLLCPTGMEGNVSRSCDIKGNWLKDITAQCTRREFLELLENVNLLKDGIGDVEEKVPELFSKMKNLTASNLYIGDLETSSETLNIITDISKQKDITISNETMKNFMNVASNLLDVNLTDSWQNINDKNGEWDSTNILKSVEDLSGLFEPTDNTFEIIETNVQLKGTRYNGSKNDFQKSFPNTIIFIPFKSIFDQIITVTSIYLPTMSEILPKRFPNSSKDYSVGSAVLSTVITHHDNSSNDNSDMEISMNFTILNNSNPYDSLCTFWNYSANGEWSSTGCNETVEGNQTMCTCNHLTSFSVLISPKTVTSLGLEIITYVGVGISIGALVVALIIEILIWRFFQKDQISKIRHIILVNICLTLLFADIWFLMAVSPLAKESFCIALTFLMHFFYMGLFFWMLCEGCFLFYKVAFPFHFATSTIIARYLFILGYVCPTIITVTTIAVTQPRNIYRREETCWLNWDQSRALLAFIVPAFIIVGINFIFLMVVVYKICAQGRMAVSTTNDDIVKLQRIMRSLAIKMPVLGTTWGIGIFAFAPGAAQNEGLHYTFAILNAFQGLLILILDYLLDATVRHYLKRVVCGYSWRDLSSSLNPQSSDQKTNTTSKGKSEERI